MTQSTSPKTGSSPILIRVPVTDLASVEAEGDVINRPSFPALGKTS